MKRAVLCALALILPIAALQAEPGADTVQGSASAEIVRPLRAQPLRDLSFGAVVVGNGAGGAVVVADDGAGPRYTGNARQGCRGNDNCRAHPASFAVSGEAFRFYRVEVPGQITAVGASTGYQLEVGDLTLRSRNQPEQGQGGQLDALGTDSFAIGGTLHLPAGTAPDIFRAVLPVIVSYN